MWLVTHAARLAVNNCPTHLTAPNPFVIVLPMSNLTAAELTSARAIRATMKPNGSLDPKRFDDFRAANRASREQHGDDRHEAVKACAAHAGIDKIDRMIAARA